jgi:hypothetical protein
MRKIPCPISGERLSSLYLDKKLNDEEIALLLCSEGIEATKKRVATWRADFGVETLYRWERFNPPPIEGTLKSLLIGSMLGDGRIAFRGTASHYEERHAPNQLEYLEWKADEWGDWSAGELTVAMSREFPSYIFRTKAHGMLNEYRDLFYTDRDGGWKVTKPEVVDLVDDLALTIWYLDDGCAGGHWPRLSYGAKEGSRENAYKIFEKFNLHPKWDSHQGHDTTGYFLFRDDDADRFVNIIKPYVPRCMEYKLHLGYMGKFVVEGSTERVARNKDIKKKMTKELLEGLVNAGETYASMSKELGVGEGTIGRWLVKYGLKTQKS